MKTVSIAILMVGVLGCLGTEAFCQTKKIEHLPDEEYAANWQPVFYKKIVSYVQLPGDPLEYRKIDSYVFYRAKPDIDKKEEQLKSGDLKRQRYLGPHLEKTGRTFIKLLDDSVLGVENKNLTTQDQLMNNEMMFGGIGTSPYID
ncbi:hypothetical protein L0657_22165 [Dyadobacter sp. CY345]|uniref:hypothetical protein n=1 Tax=Dyadobacter sp. CY345 TaxID=2909335 RepID=UPI001F273B64|nr:hypothetical protein [Dyadobacter sp. CY345]MCF2446679.1 hypothetical protein [Dyadobacter sp. CY345]